MVRVVETPIFIPYTKDSTLRKMIQAADDKVGEETNSHTVKDIIPTMTKLFADIFFRLENSFL